MFDRPQEAPGSIQGSRGDPVLDELAVPHSQDVVADELDHGSVLMTTTSPTSGDQVAFAERADLTAGPEQGEALPSCPSFTSQAVRTTGLVPGCPELYLDDAAPPEKRVVFTDDFGQRIQMSLGQLADLVADVRRGVLDDALATVSQ